MVGKTNHSCSRMQRLYALEDRRAIIGNDNFPLGRLDLRNTPSIE